jgi:hypothetical protein
VLNVREVPTPQAGSGEIRVRVTAAGLIPMDGIITADADTAARFGLSLPVGFGTDYTGVVDQTGSGVTGFEPGDRVCGGAVSPTSWWWIQPEALRRARPTRLPMTSTTGPPPPLRLLGPRLPPLLPLSIPAGPTRC